MTDINLENMSLGDLKKLQRAVEKTIAGYSERQKQAALEAAEAAAREMGFTLSELIGTPKARRSKPEVSAKYEHPENASLTWSGRGRRPAWIREAVDSGRSLDDFLIKS